MSRAWTNAFIQRAFEFTQNPSQASLLKSTSPLNNSSLKKRLRALNGEDFVLRYFKSMLYSEKCFFFNYFKLLKYLILLS